MAQTMRGVVEPVLPGLAIAASILFGAMELRRSTWDYRWALFDKCPPIIAYGEIFLPSVMHYSPPIEHESWRNLIQIAHQGLSKLCTSFHLIEHNSQSNSPTSVF